MQVPELAVGIGLHAGGDGTHLDTASVVLSGSSGEVLARNPPPPCPKSTNNIMHDCFSYLGT